MHFSIPFLDELVTVKPPKDCRNDPKEMWLLLKALYGLRRAPKLWAEHFRKILQKLGWKATHYDPSVYYHAESGSLLLIHVDDILLSADYDFGAEFSDY